MKPPSCSASRGQALCLLAAWHSFSSKHQSLLLYSPAVGEFEAFLCPMFPAGMAGRELGAARHLARLPSIYM